MISDLPHDLEEEILSRVPITSLRAVRSTCKQWNRLFKDGSLLKNHRGKEFLAIKRNGSKVCLMSINLQGNQPIKRIGKTKLEYTSSRFIHCNGLLLFTDFTRLVVWNPYLGQTRRVEPRRVYCKKDAYGFGYDKNNNHKILRLVYGLNYNFATQEIYNLNSNSWKVHPSPSAIVYQWCTGVSVKGSSYFLAKEKGKEEVVGNAFFLLGFDFTREAFGPRLELPYLPDGREEYLKVLSSLREEKLVVLLRRRSYTLEMEIWITDKVEPNAVSWNKFLAVNFATVTGFEYVVYPWRGFFVDEEKKVVVFSEMTAYGPQNETWGCIIWEDGYLKNVDRGDDGPFVCSYYAPSLVQI
ncbi:putative F-box protein [Raphanus sativus]|uniref:F-box protein At3g19560 n=1 Tax=Raphanus sativus TaxID=3726 RepID=A0A9W3CD96_RAPSA|nr:putative F-box protein At3g19560 [Raphanus sativus]KAJ4877384.1 putative F-box protein [Raphanus sativus]